MRSFDDPGLSMKKLNYISKQFANNCEKHFSNFQRHTINEYEVSKMDTVVEQIGVFCFFLFNILSSSNFNQ